MEEVFFDVTVPIKSGMVHWPGDPEVEINKFSSMASGDRVNISGISMSVHTGTHMDAPLHFIAEGKDITELPPELMTGRCQVLNIDNETSIGRSELEKKSITCDRVFFRTRNSETEWFTGKFSEKYVYLDTGGAEFLVSKGVRLAGIDYLSIAQFKAGEEVHRILLGNSVWIIEGLYLKNVPEGEYDMFAFPLKVNGGDGAPVRVILKKVQFPK